MHAQVIEKSIVVPIAARRIHAALGDENERPGLVPAVTMTRDGTHGCPRLYIWIAVGPALHEIEFCVTEPVAGRVLVESGWSHRIERRYMLEAIDGGSRTRITSRLTLRLADHDVALAGPLRTLQASELIGLATLARRLSAGESLPAVRYASHRTPERGAGTRLPSPQRPVPPRASAAAAAHSPRR